MLQQSSVDNSDDMETKTDVGWNTSTQEPEFFTIYIKEEHGIDTNLDPSLGQKTAEVEGDKSFDCGLCGVVFEPEFELRCHIHYRNSEDELHNGVVELSEIATEKSEEDSRSPVVLTGSQHLLTQVRLADSQAQKLFKCDNEGCQESFSNKRLMVRHSVVHGEKKFKCLFKGCNKSFYYKSKLNNHKREHSGVRPFICNFEDCQDSFAFKINLERHMRVHDDERPFKCGYKNCPSSFKHKNHVKVHMRVQHSDQGRFKCEHENCSSSFKLKHLLMKHKRLHTNENSGVPLEN